MASNAVTTIRSRFVHRVQQFDVYPKQLDEIKVKSSWGAAVTIIGVAIVTFLLVSETVEFFNPVREDVLLVNHNRDERMKINVRMTFFNLPCQSVSLDIADKFGENQNPATIFKTVQKQPYKGDFPTLWHSMKEQYGTLDTYDFENLLWEAMWADATNTQPAAGNKGLGRRLGSLFGKMMSNPFLKRALRNDGKEGCMLKGYMEVNKVEGNFHLAVGESHSENGGHHHHWAAETRHLGFNATHYIHHLSFGEPFPGVVHPLDAFWFVEEGLASQQQYFIQVVPTKYVQASGTAIHTNQYSVTYHRTAVDPMSPMNTRLPGVFFKYQISPILVKIEEKARTWSHFLTRVCAVIGGVWVVIGMLYNSARATVSKITKKKE